MRPYPSVPSPMTACRDFVCLCAALCTVTASMAQAQEPASPDQKQTSSRAAGGEIHACVDPADPAAPRRLQDGPCKLPMVQLPLPEVSESGELPRWQTPRTGLPAKDRGHAMFWRFPVQGRGPHEVPRHSWR